jgi:DNA-directed RNA polymerase subunit M/transcription elongation factor TFIIS
LYDSILTPHPLGSDPSNPSSTSSQNRLECHTCPYEYTITKRIFERKTFPKKEKDDIIGGPEQWENAQKAEMNCPKDSCAGDVAAFYQIQIRSADEPMTGFYRVCIFILGVAGRPPRGAEAPGRWKRREKRWLTRK